MKKFSMVFSLLAVINLSAQKFSIDLAGGYSTGIAGVSSSTETETVENGVYTETETFLPMSFSSGWIGRLGLTAHLNDQLFITFATRYRKSGEKEYNFYTDSYSNGTYLYDETESIFIKHSNIEMQFGLGLQRNICEKFSLSMSAGPSVGVFSTMVHRYVDMETEVDLPDTYQDNSEDTYEYKPFFMLGAYSDIALNYKLSDKLALFGNATLRLQTYSAKTSQMTSSIDNGVEEVGEKSIYQTHTEYSNSVSNNNQGPPDFNNPRQENRNWTPASSLEFVVGLRYSMGAEPKVAVASSGKKGLHFTLLGGYGLPLAGESLYSFDQNNSTTEMYSFGSGVNFGLMADYTLVSGIAIEVGAAYNKSTTTYSHSFGNNPPDKHTNIGTMVRIQTGIKIEGDANRFNPFIRAGISTGVATKVVMKYETEATYEEEELTGRLSVGGYGGLGVSVKLSPSISLIAQGTAFIQSWSPSHYQRTKSTFNGVDQLSNYSVSSNEAEFVNEITTSSNDPEPDPNQPSQVVKMKTPFSAAVFSLGIRIGIGK